MMAGAAAMVVASAAEVAELAMEAAPDLACSDVQISNNWHSILSQMSYLLLDFAEWRTSMSG
jgi:hypothetical protein